MLQWMPIKLISILKAATLTTLFLLVPILTAVKIEDARFCQSKIGTVFCTPNTVQAQSVADPTSELQAGVQIIEQPLGLPATDIRLIVARIIRAALGLVGIVVLVLMLYGGFLWMTAGGNEEQISSAKKVLLNTAIGLAIILSAYAIASFVISRLVGATTGVEDGSDTIFGAPVSQNFSGSGALGQIVKDHYPARDQTDVPRNVRIVVTFRRPLKVDSFVDDTTGDGVFGNCRTTVENWYNDCDRLKSVDDNFINIKRADNGEKIFGAVVLASATTEDGITGVYSIMVKPIINAGIPDGGYLGSPTEAVSYIVHLGAGMLLDDPANNNPSAFQSQILGNNYYEWQFGNSTALDTAPPFVTNVFPARAAAEASNSVIQINFSEPVDPVGIQGNFNANPDFYYLDGQNIFLKSNNSTVPLGSFSLTNGYRTLEFTPSRECGRNACGGKIYCLPVCDKPGATCAEDDYEVLVRAARVLNPGSFAAQPFSGVSDLAGNALDGNQNNVANTAPSTLPIFPNQKQPDNFFWDFKINNRVDATAPYIQVVLPGRDAQYITRNQELSMVFNKRMRAEPMYDIVIEEHPPQVIPIWRVPLTSFNADDTTYTRINHGPFLDGVRQYYFPVVSSTVEDVHFNCFYPGKGPDEAVNLGGISSPECNEANPQNCCQVITAQNGAFCCNGTAGAGILACLDYLRTNSL